MADNYISPDGSPCIFCSNEGGMACFALADNSISADSSLGNFCSNEGGMVCLADNSISLDGSPGIFLFKGRRNGLHDRPLQLSRWFPWYFLFK
jgi:hypothetical protein